MIARLSWAMRAALVGKKFLRSSLRFSFHKKEKSAARRQWLVTAQNLQSMKTFLIIELSQHSSLLARVVVLFPPASRLLPAVTATDKKKHYVCCARQTSPSCAWARPQRALPLMLQSKPSILSWNCLWEWWQDDSQRLELGLKLELYSLTNKL